MSPEIQADREKLTTTAKKHAELKRAIDLINRLEKAQEGFSNNEKMINEETNEDLRIMATEENKSLESRDGEQD